VTEADDAQGTGPEPGPSGTAPLKPEVSADRFASLSPQERRLLNLVAGGLTDMEIGDRLSIPERAVGKYVEDMLSKLGLQTRTQAVLFAINRAFQSADPSPAQPPDEPD
jgi:two-component system response regulator DevR